ncbi:MAG: hypothetical protein AAFR79_00585, partial [Pseudomonadota bacterium]
SYNPVQGITAWYDDWVEISIYANRSTRFEVRFKTQPTVDGPDLRFSIRSGWLLSHTNGMVTLVPTTVLDSCFTDPV